jgi:N-acetylglucosaminyl-diphospho-decaprenol L-rhamnosyltransferase
MPPIGIVIVTYNSEAVIGPCLDAALRSGAAIVVVDNASSDGTRTAVVQRGVCLLTNDSNLGFAKAANQGFAVLDCTYVLLLNPDAVLSSSLEPLREACDLPEAAGAGGLLLDAKGRPQAGFMVRQLPTPAVLAMESLLLNRLWPGNPINAAYRGLKLDYAVRQRVEQPAGAFLLIRRAVWEQLGGFDERFWPLWFEDVDFCHRALDRGYCFYYVPTAVAIHTGGHSIPALTLEMRRIYWYRSLLGYAAKHFHPLGVRAVCVAVITGSFLRAAVEAALERSLRPFAAYGKVARLASRLLIGEVRQTRT